VNLPFSSRIDKHETFGCGFAEGPDAQDRTLWLGGKIDEVALIAKRSPRAPENGPDLLRGAVGQLSAQSCAALGDSFRITPSSTRKRPGTACLCL
jgi:hypothetical protein